MFRFVPRRLAIGAYSMFMIEQKAHPKLAGLAIGDRGKTLSKMYKNLSPAERSQLEKRASMYVSKKSKAKAKAKAAKPARQPSAYTMFVKNNIHKFDKLPHKDRMKAVAKLWQQQQARK